jgi:putative ABC transport system substrate-binding protein
MGHFMRASKNMRVSKKYRVKNILNIFQLFWAVTLIIAAGLTCSLAAGTPQSSPENNHRKTLGITQIVEHPALNAVRHGLLRQLTQEGFIEGQNLNVLYENAQGSTLISTQIAHQFLSSPLDVAVAISTPSAQALFFLAQKQDKALPIVFSAVSDPQSAKLQSPDNRPYPITGVTDTPNLLALRELIQSMMPQLKTIGVIYNLSESNSVATVKTLKTLFQERGIQVYEVTVNKTADVAQVTQNLIGKVEAVYLPQDNTVVAAVETVAGILAGSNASLTTSPIPIFTSDPVLVKKGIVAGVGFDYEQVGIETGKVVAQILRGENASTIPVHTPGKIKAVINKPLAETYHLVVPNHLENAEIVLLENL